MACGQCWLCHSIIQCCLCCVSSCAGVAAAEGTPGAPWGPRAGFGKAVLCTGSWLQSHFVQAAKVHQGA